MTRSNGIHPLAIEDPDAAPSARSGLPVVVIGAGPVGLAAAAHLLDRGLEPLVLEAGSQVGANIAQWRHVRLFSPWCLALDPVSVRLLEQAGWTGPDPDALPTGADLLERYLSTAGRPPALASRIRLHTTVVAVARQDLDKVRSPGRDQLPFLVRVRDRDGRLADLQARAVIDASGTWTQPNPLGASGLPALGEPDAAARIAYGLPDIGGRDRGPLCRPADGGGRGRAFRCDQPARPGRAATAGAGDRGRVGGPLSHPAAAGRQGQRRGRRAPGPGPARHRPGRPGRGRPHRTRQRLPDPHRRAGRRPGPADRRSPPGRRRPPRPGPASWRLMR